MASFFNLILDTLAPSGLTLKLNSGATYATSNTVTATITLTDETKTGYQMAQVGDSIDLSYATVNSRRGRVGKQIAHTLTTGCQQGTLNFIDLNPDPKITEDYYIHETLEEMQREVDKVTRLTASITGVQSRTA